MPCNLAVSITKAAVQDEQLTKLLTPDIVKTLLEAFIGQHPDHQEQKPHASIRKQTGQVSLYITRFDCWLTVQNGQVTISTPRWYREEANALVEQIATLLVQGAEKLFDQQIAQALKKLGQVSKRSIEVDNQGRNVPATLFTLDI